MPVLRLVSPSLLALCHQAIKLANPPRSQMNMFVEIVQGFVQHEESAKNVNAESGVYVEFYRRRIGGGWVLSGEIAEVDDAEYQQAIKANIHQLEANR